MTTGHVAVIDIGKTNAKLALVDLADLSEISVTTRPNVVLPGPPYPHFDTEGHWAFLLDGLAAFHAQHGVDAISITTHGAAVALLDEDGRLAAPILDYEFAGPDEMAEDYDRIRPGFAQTGSPRLAGGLNVGAQLHWQFARDPGLRERVTTIVTYPQYWAARLTGVHATDVTSLGCHTDLWNPHEGRFSPLVGRLGLTGLMAPPRQPGETLGSILPRIAAQTGLRQNTPVVCGIHDSNASLLPYILGQDAPFSVVSTGTWVIAMAVGGDAVALDPDKDTLINVSARGQPVPSARFMGGREHDLAMGGPYPAPTARDLGAVLKEQTMLLPALVAGTGPFRGQSAEWIGSEPPPGSARRGAAVALYLALVTAECLEAIGHKGGLLVEGPFAANAVFLRMLACLTGSAVTGSTGMTGTSQGAALLCATGRPRPVTGNSVHPDNGETGALMGTYQRRWRELIRLRQQG